jgi:hypothetical protein
MEFNIDKLLLPFATSMVGLIPVLINLAAGWADRKSKVARMHAFLQQTNQRMGFLQSWFNLQKEVSSPEQLSQIKGALAEELQDIYESLAEALLDSYSETDHRRELMSRYKKTTPLRRFLLLYSPYNARGWLFHTLYYMCILPIIFGVGYVIYQFMQTNTWIENIPQEYMYAGVALLALLFIFRWFGRLAAWDVEGRLATISRKTVPLRAGSD